jgi:hypothetical protein
MALVNGPLFSLDASGQVAKALVYSRWKGRPYVRKYVVPANPDSLGQKATRSMMGFISGQWASLSTTDQDSWNSLAAAAGYSSFNAYTSGNMDQHALGNAPSQNSARGETAPAQESEFDSQTGGVGRIDGTVSLAAAATNEWGIEVRIGTTASPTVATTTPAAIVAQNGTTDVPFEITGLEPGTYYLATRSFSDDGAYGTVDSVEGPITVT